ncbi:uncharacterized protein LOC134855422 isoform X2 [Symsagittifera roscoffensis]|uniref:uncharacterized protein LOC134855422 isoform X2 n=1 Tax=Symsagittifera roscoffensis TaxID=84072 RepID=UPI00307C9C31
MQRFLDDSLDVDPSNTQDWNFLYESHKSIVMSSDGWPQTDSEDKNLDGNENKKQAKEQQQPTSSKGAAGGGGGGGEGGGKDSHLAQSQDQSGNSTTPEIEDEVAQIYGSTWLRRKDSADMYGQTNSFVKKSSSVPKCERHVLVECAFWCQECSVAICLKCVQNAHRGHSFLLLDSIIDYKVKEAIYRLDFLKKNMSYVESNIVACQNEIDFHNNQVKLFIRRQRECNEIRELPNVFTEHMSELKNMANGLTHEVDEKILSKVLKVLQKTDDDFFWVKSTLKSPTVKTLPYSMQTQRFKFTVNPCTLSAFRLFKKKENNLLATKISCHPIEKPDKPDSKKSKWEVKADFKCDEQSPQSD